MITLYGQILNETEDWLVFAPALTLEDCPELGKALLLGKSSVSVTRHECFDLDAVRINGRCRRGRGRPRRTKLLDLPLRPKRQQFLFSP